MTAVIQQHAIRALMRQLIFGHGIRIVDVVLPLVRRLASKGDIA
jgi:hypothetical protein